MALSMMAEKECGNIEGNDFQSLWTKVTQHACGERYDSPLNMILGPYIMRRLTAL